MRKLAIGIAIGSAALIANAASACDNKTETAEQPQAKPSVAAKSQKANKRQKTKTANQTKTTVAQADKK